MSILSSLSSRNYLNVNNARDFTTIVNAKFQIRKNTPDKGRGDLKKKKKSNVRAKNEDYRINQAFKLPHMESSQCIYRES